MFEGFQVTVKKVLFAHTVGMEKILNEAKGLQKELVEMRRRLHGRAELGFALTETAAFVKETLAAMGYEPQSCGRSGLTVTVGKGEKTFLLRADMDGLPIKEKTGLPFACKNGNMHACGHDMHTAMLLGAAKLLKTREKALKGTVKLLFQPAEELLEGAKNALENGVLDAPKVSGAMMLHVMTNVPIPTGSVVVSSAGVSAPAADYFTVEVKGKGCHGSAPWNGVDALSVAAHILLALQELPARELSLAEPAVLTVGSMVAGEAGNVIADTALLKGTLRAFDERVRERVKRRLEEIAKNVAKAFRAKARVVYGSGCPSLLNDEKLSLLTEKVLKDLLGENAVFTSSSLQGDTKSSSGGSEDFAYISRKVPSVMVALAAGETEKGYAYPLHHPKAQFDEAALSIGAAVYAHTAIEWLKGE